MLGSINKAKTGYTTSSISSVPSKRVPPAVPMCVYCNKRKSSEVGMLGSDEKRRKVVRTAVQVSSVNSLIVISRLIVFLLLSNMTLAVQNSTQVTSSDCSISPWEHYGGLFADCSSRSLRHVPHLEGNITALDLSSNNVILQANVFQMFPFLMYLDISFNDLKELPSNTFRGISKLVILDLSHNRLKYNNISYPEDVFDHLKNLVHLNMGNNDNMESEQYPDTIFQSLANLQNLSIDTFVNTNFGIGFGALSELRKLDLSGDVANCAIEELHNDTFSIFNSTKLLTLDMSHCPHLTKIEVNSFAPLIHLQNLHLDYTYIGLRESLRALYGLMGRNMSSITLCSIGLVRVPASKEIKDQILELEDIKYLNTMCVTKLILSDNHILYFNVTSFLNSRVATCLKHLDVGNNAFYGMYDITNELIISSLKLNLEYLDISNSYNSFDSRSMKQGTFSLTSVNNYTYFFPRKLKTAIADHLSTNLILPSSLHISFFNSNVLDTFSVCHFDRVILEGSLSGFNKLKTLKIAHSLSMTLSETFFDTFPSLENIYLNNVGLPEDYFYKHGKRLFSRLTHLTLLDLSGNGISRLPIGIFKDNPRLETLLLSNNRFHNFPLNIHDSPGLLFLNLSYNKIRFIDHISRNELDLRAEMNSSFRLSLSGNSFVCFCKDVFFVYWLQQNYTSDDRSQHTCITPSGKTALVKDINGEQLWQSCVGKDFFFLAVSLTASGCLVFLSTILFVKHKTQIMCFFKKLIRRSVAFPKREDFKFDIFLGYAEDDYPNVYFDLGKYLEDRLGYCLYMYHKDSIPGEDRASSILYGINNSWKTVFFMSQTFLDDHWSFYTMQAAVYATSVLIPNRIILVQDQKNPCEIPDFLLCVVDEDRIVLTPNTSEDASWDILKRIIK